MSEKRDLLKDLETCKACPDKDGCNGCCPRLRAVRVTPHSIGRALEAEARRINLGPNCAKCICSICPGLLECGTMCGNTAVYCVTECRGEEGCMGACSEGAAMIRAEKRGGE